MNLISIKKWVIGIYLAFLGKQVIPTNRKNWENEYEGGQQGFNDVA